MGSTKAYLTEQQALEAAENLENAVDKRLSDYLFARSNGKKEAVIDFLFEYYTFRPIKLKIWSPGIGVKIENTARTKALLAPFKTIESNDFLQLDPVALTDKRIGHMRAILALQKAIANKPPHYGCYGLHEWAMLYKSDQKRHPYLSLRVSQAILDKTVAQNPIRCTHFDAFRFFTDEAVPLNEQSLAREKVLHFEQGGCIHNNMDLYKWSFKFYPWLPSELIWQAFSLALKARIVDMEASPYDVRAYGYESIEIELQSGMKTYVQKQKKLAEEAALLRNRWIAEISAILDLMKAKTKIANQL